VSLSSGQLADDLRVLLQAESDYGVMRLMASSDETWARAAFEEYHRRFHEYVWKVCCDVGKNLHCEPWIEFTARETLLRALNASAQFKFVECPREEEAYVIKAWLSRIATNILRDHWRRTRLERTASDRQWALLADKTDDSPVTFEDSPVSAPDDEKMVLIQEAIDSLREREGHILRVTFQFYRVGQKFQRLPNDVVDALAESLNTTAENLRKIRERALKKIRAYIQARLQGPNQK
jgi:DNA-directed RNA polymerase specialized sigma24 family protein